MLRAESFSSLDNETRLEHAADLDANRGGPDFATLLLPDFTHQSKQRCGVRRVVWLANSR